MFMNDMHMFFDFDSDLLDELPGRGHDEDLRARLVGYPSLRLSLKVEGNLDHIQSLYRVGQKSGSWVA